MNLTAKNTAPETKNQAIERLSRESYDRKDGMRIDDMADKAYGVDGRNLNEEKLLTLARNMAKAITGYEKAYRRALAAEDRNYHDVAKIFYDRFDVLFKTGKRGASKAEIEKEFEKLNDLSLTALQGVYRAVFDDVSDRPKTKEGMIEEIMSERFGENYLRVLGGKAAATSLLADPMRKLEKLADVFPTEEALKKYLKDHPNADKSNHSVEKSKSEKGEADGGGKSNADIPEKAKPEELPPEYREEIADYKISLVGDNSKRAIEIARKVKKGIDRAADICKMSPSVCKGNKGLTRDKMPQIIGDASVKDMLASKKPDDRAKGEAMVQAGADPNSDKSVLDMMIDHLEDHGVSTTKKKLAVGQIKATQNEIKAEKVFGMADAYLKGKFGSIDSSVIVSKDGFLLDGHHRWAALLTVDPSFEMNVKMIDMDMDDLLKEAASVPGVFKANFNGDPLPEAEQKKYKAENKSTLSGKKAPKKTPPAEKAEEEKPKKQASLSNVTLHFSAKNTKFDGALEVDGSSITGMVQVEDLGLSIPGSSSGASLAGTVLVSQIVGGVERLAHLDLTDVVIESMADVTFSAVRPPSRIDVKGVLKVGTRKVGFKGTFVPTGYFRQAWEALADASLLPHNRHFARNTMPNALTELEKLASETKVAGDVYIDDVEKPGEWNLIIRKYSPSRWSHFTQNPHGGGGGTGAYSSARAALAGATHVGDWMGKTKAWVIVAVWDPNLMSKADPNEFGDYRVTKTFWQPVGGGQPLARIAYSDPEYASDAVKPGEFNIQIRKYSPSRWGYFVANPVGGGGGSTAFTSASSALAAAVHRADWKGKDRVWVVVSKWDPGMVAKGTVDEYGDYALSKAFWLPVGGEEINMPRLAAEIEAITADSSLPGDPPDLDEKMGRFEKGKPADPMEEMSPEDARKWKEMHNKHKDNFKKAKFEEGVSADPTKNMSEEDAAEWEKMNEAHKDNFKKAGWGRREMVVHPENIIQRALMNRLITPAEANSREMKDSAREEAENLAERWPEGEGFGSSDMTPVIQSVLENVGILTGYVNGRLTRMEAKYKRGDEVINPETGKKVKVFGVRVDYSGKIVYFVTGGTLFEHELDVAEKGKRAKFEEGVSADPTKNMSEEDAAEWEKMNEAHKDNFKKASDVDALWGEMAKTAAFGVEAKILKTSLTGNRTSITALVTVPVKAAAGWNSPHDDQHYEDMIIKRYGADIESAIADAMLDHMPEGSPDISFASNSLRIFFPPKITGYKASLEVFIEALAPKGKTAASGLYGYKKAVQNDCEACVRKLQKSASSIARTAWGKDPKVAAFLQTHAKRAGSLPAKILVAAMKGLGPQIEEEIEEDEALAKTAGFNPSTLRPSAENLWHEVMMIAENDGDAYRKKDARSAILKAFAEYLKLERGGMQADFDDIKGRMIEALKSRWSTDSALNTMPGDRDASSRVAAKGRHGLYGFKAKTSSLGLASVTQLRETAGHIAGDLNSRRADRHEFITGFLKEHQKQAKCLYSNLLCSSYPESDFKKVAATPSSVSDWLAWDKSAAPLKCPECGGHNGQHSPDCASAGKWGPVGKKASSPAEKDWLEMYERPGSVIFNRMPANWDVLQQLVKDKKIAPTGKTDSGGHMLYQTVKGKV